MSDRVVVVDYGAGNLRSAAKALSAAGAADVVVAGDVASIAAADRIVLPGVGAFAHCIGALRGVAGLEAALDRAVHGRGVPFLGICVGMQLLADEGHEHGVHAGLGWLPGTVERLAGGAGLKVPHIGWNDVTAVGGHLVEPGSAYFVHSYRFAATHAEDVVATADYGEVFPAVIARGNVTGVQFHPEKSQGYGLAFLRRWLASSDVSPAPGPREARVSRPSPEPQASERQREGEALLDPLPFRGGGRGVGATAQPSPNA